MSKKNIFKSHHYPKILFRHPWLIVFYYAFVLLAYPRYIIFIYEFNRLLKNRKLDKILEIGYGEGLHLLLFAIWYRGITFYGFDIREENRIFVERVCEFFRIKNIRLLKEKDFESLPANLFDIIYMVGVLQYVENDVHIMLNIKSMLKHKGKLVIYQPVRYKKYLGFVDQFVDKYEHYEKEAKIKRLYSEIEFLHLLHSTGFTVLICKKYAFKIYSIAHEIFLLFYVPVVKDYRLIIKIISSIGLFTLMPFIFLANFSDLVLKLGDNNSVLTVAALGPVNELI